MTWRVFGCWHAHRLAGFDIELGTMPWADQAIAIERTIAECASVVGAHILDAMNLAVDFDKYDEAVIDFERLRLVWAYLISGANVIELRHR